MRTTIAQDPDLSISPLGLLWAISINAFSAASKPFNKASLGFHGKLASLITYDFKENIQIITY